MGRTHFIAAAEAMRHILNDRARRKRAVRHGGDHPAAEFEEAELACTITRLQTIHWISWQHHHGAVEARLVWPGRVQD